MKIYFIIAISLCNLSVFPSGILHIKEAPSSTQNDIKSPPHTSILMQEASNSKLIEAAKAGKFIQVLKLLGAGADWSCKDKAGKTILTYFPSSSASGQSMERCMVLLDVLKDDLLPTINELGDQGVSLFLSHGIDLCRVLSAKALSNAVKNGNNIALQKLLDVGVDADACLEDGNTALILAVMFQNEKACELLIKHGASLNHKNAEGDTALHLAVHYAIVPASKSLLAQGADPLAKNKKGQTPLALAKGPDLLKIKAPP